MITSTQLCKSALMPSPASGMSSMKKLIKEFSNSLSSSFQTSVSTGCWFSHAIRPLVGGPTRKYERPTLHRRPIKSQSHLELELIKCNFRSLNILMGIRMALNESSFVNCLTEIAPVTAHSTVRIPLGFGAQDFEESPVRKCDKGSILPITTRGRGGGNNLQQLPPTIVTDGADGVPGLIKRSLLSRLFQAD